MTSPQRVPADRRPSLTPPFTELSARRLGPIRQFFVRHPVAMDVVVAGFFALISVAGAVAVANERPDLQPFATAVQAVVLVGLGALALLARRRHPVTVSAVLTALMVISLALTKNTQGFELGLAFALYAVAAARPARVAWWVLGASQAAVGGAIWLWEMPMTADSMGLQPGDPGPPPFDSRFWSVLGVLVVSVTALAIGISVRNRRLHLAQLIDRANEIARDRDQQAQIARAAERARIAREMHDVVAHSLSVMIALADGAGAALARNPDRSRAALEELSSTGRSALGDMRRVLGVLGEDGAPLEPQPGYLDLDELVERYRTAGVPVRTTGLSTPLPADAGLQLAVYRIVQEALTNALRHAPGSAVEVALRRTDERIEIEIRDDGANVVVPDAGGAGQGLIGMRERAGVFGGTVDAGPWRGGWRVTAVLPWKEEET